MSKKPEHNHQAFWKAVLLEIVDVMQDTRFLLHNYALLSPSGQGCVKLPSWSLLSKPFQGVL